MAHAQQTTGIEDERAVSPIIGVILLVAITVILASVIAVFVVELGGSQNEPVQAGLNVDNASGVVTVQVADMGNAEEVVVRNDSSGSLFGSGECDGTDASSGRDCVLTAVGQQAEYRGAGNSTHVLAVSGEDENLLRNVD